MRTSSIAEAINRFRESPPRSREEREEEQSKLAQVGSPLALPSRFWWQRNQEKEEEVVVVVEEGTGKEEESEHLRPPLFQGVTSLDKTAAEELSEPVLSLQDIRASLAASLGSSHENKDEKNKSPLEATNIDAENEEEEEEEEEEEIVDEDILSDRAHARPVPAQVVQEAEQVLVDPVVETREKTETAQRTESHDSVREREAGPPTEASAVPVVAQQEERREDAGEQEKVESSQETVSDESTLALQALASQHPKLFRALQSMDSKEDNGDGAEEVGSRIDTVEALETIVAEPLDALEDVIDEKELLDESEEESSEEKEEKEESSSDLASETPAVLEALHDELGDKLEEARRSSDLDLSTKEDELPLGPTQEGSSLEAEARGNEGDGTPQESQDDLISGRDHTEIAVEETKAHTTMNTDEFSDDGGDEIIQRVLSEIEEQVGADVFNSDFATNLELQAMIRKQIEVAQMQNSPVRDEKLEDRIRSVLSTPEASSSKGQEEGEREDVSVSASRSLENTLESYKTYNNAATLIQTKYRQYKSVQFQKEVEEQKEKEKQDEFQVYVSKCTGKIDSLWSEVSGLLAMFPLLCIQMYRDSLLMNNQKPHQHLQTKDIIKYLASILPIDRLGQSYMQALFQIDAYTTVSMEQLHSSALDHLSLGHVQPDPNWDTQRKYALDILQSDNAKHVFESLDIDGSNTFSLNRVVCGFEILFEERSKELRTFCKQLIHYFACKNVEEISYADIVTAFKLNAGLADKEIEEGNSKEGTSGSTEVNTSEEKSEVKEMTREMEMNAKMEQNLKIIEQLYEALAEAEQKSGKESSSDSGDSISEMIKAVEELPDSDIDELNEEIKSQMQQQTNWSNENEGESKIQDQDQDQNQNQNDDETIPKAEDMKPTSSKEAEVPVVQERVTSEIEIEMEKPATQDSSTQVIEESFLCEPRTNTLKESKRGSPKQQMGSNKERILNKAMDRIRLAKRIDHQKKVKDNLLLQIGDLCIDDLKSKLPDNCRLKKSLERKERDSQLAKDALKSDSIGGKTPGLQSTSSPAMIPESNVDSQWGFADYPLQSEMQYNQKPHVDVNHNRLSDVSGRICRDLDNLLINYENRVSPSKRVEMERGGILPQGKGNGSEMSGQEQESTRPEIEGKSYHSHPLYSSPYYGTSNPSQPNSSYGFQTQQSFPREETQSKRPNTLPLEAGSMGLNTQRYPSQHHQHHPSGLHATTPGGRDYPIEDRFQYISKSIFGGDTSAIFSMHKGWSNAFLPSMGSPMDLSSQFNHASKPPTKIENFEKDDLKRAYVNTWQQVQAVYHK